MGGLTQPTQERVDPVASSLQPLRDFAGRALLQQLQQRNAQGLGRQAMPRPQGDIFDPVRRHAVRQQNQQMGFQSQEPVPGMQTNQGFGTGQGGQSFQPQFNVGNNPVGGGQPGAGSPTQQGGLFDLPQFQGPLVAPFNPLQMQGAQGFQDAISNNPLVSTGGFRDAIQQGLGGFQTFDPQSDGSIQNTLNQFDTPSVADDFFSQLFQGGPQQGGNQGQSGPQIQPPALDSGAVNIGQSGMITSRNGPGGLVNTQPDGPVNIGQSGMITERNGPGGLVNTGPFDPANPGGGGQQGGGQTAFDPGGFSEEILGELAPDIIEASRAALNPERAPTGTGRRELQQAINLGIANAREEASGFGLNPGAIDRAGIIGRGAAEPAARIAPQLQQADTAAFNAQQQNRIGALNALSRLPGFTNIGFNNELAQQRNQISALPALLNREERGFNRFQGVTEPAAQRQLQTLGMLPQFRGIPGQEALQLFGLGSQFQNTQDVGIQRALQEFARTQGGGLNQIISLLSGIPGMQTGFGPSPLSQIGSIAQGAAAFVPGI